MLTHTRARIRDRREAHLQSVQLVLAVERVGCAELVHGGQVDEWRSNPLHDLMIHLQRMSGWRRLGGDCWCEEQREEQRLLQQQRHHESSTHAESRLFKCRCAHRESQSWNQRPAFGLE